MEPSNNRIEPMNAMSEDFLKAVERIQRRLRDIPLSMEPNSMEPNNVNSFAEHIEAAEKEVDSCALQLRAGRIEPRDWQEALSHYEDAWRQVAESLGERRN